MIFVVIGDIRSGMSYSGIRLAYLIENEYNLSNRRV